MAYNLLEKKNSNYTEEKLNNNLTGDQIEITSEGHINNMHLRQNTHRHNIIYVVFWPGMYI